MWLLCRRVKRDPASRAYVDRALTPVTEAEAEELEMFEHTEAAKQAVAKLKADAARRDKHDRARIAATG
jgi:hypothetical protein